MAINNDLKRIAANGPASQMHRLGQQLGADHLLVGTVSEFVLRRHEQRFRTTGGKETRLEMRASVSYRVLETATSEIRWADTVSFGLSDLDSAGVAGNGPTAVIDNTSRHIALGILNNIYPIRILAVRGQDRIILNQGGNLIHRGDIMDLFGPEEAVEDPTTGLYIKIDGDLLGQIQIEKVLPKYAEAKFLSEHGFSSVTDRCVVRQQSADLPRSTPQRPSRSRSKFKL